MSGPWYCFMMMGLGTFLCVFSSSWLIIWLGFELNMLAILPMMGKMQKAGELQLKYFIIQSVGSCLIIIGLIGGYYMNCWWSMSEGNMLSTIGLFIKLGLFPGHFWVPYVVGNSSWMVAMIMSTWQKIAPLFLLVYMNEVIVFFGGVITSMVGAVGGLNQTDYRSLVAYSSLVHMGWLVCLVKISFFTGVLYLMVYSIVVILLIWVLSYSSYKFTMGSESMMFFISLGGLPPMLGFVPKLLGLMSLLSGGYLMISLMLLACSGVSLAFYMRIVILGFMKQVKYKQFKLAILSQLLGGVLLTLGVSLF